MLTAKIVVDTAAYGVDKPYDYILPSEFKAKVGSRVIVPFGAGNRQVQGLILELCEREDVKRLKSVLAVTDEEPLLTDELLKIVLFLKEHTFCTYFDAVRAVLPAGCRVKMRWHYELCGETEDAFLLGLSGASEDTEFTAAEEKKLKAALKAGTLRKIGETYREISDLRIKVAALKVSEKEAKEYLQTLGKLREKHEKVLDILLCGDRVPVTELCYFAGVTAAVIKTLEKRGIITVSADEVFRTPHLEKRGTEKAEEICYSEDQQKAVCGLSKLLDSKEPQAAMLYGVTGSGKTLIYIALCDRVLKSGGQAIILLPEIALTPQFTDRFYKRYGGAVAVLHSSLSSGERYDEWKRIKAGEVQIVIGTRSAVFAPLSKLSLIVIDEEQEQTYKSESSPKYHARDVAKFRAAYNGALLLLGSATPDIDSYYSAKSGKYSYFELPGRWSSAKLPQIIISDLREDLEEGNSGVVGEKLAREMKKNLENGEQTIIFLNRRGYHTHLGCSNCGFVKKCPNCSVSMTFHSANRQLMCHYCGHTEDFSPICPECGGKSLKTLGFGTQKAEEEIKTLFKDARVLRMDADTTTRKNAHERLLSSFARGEYDILLGTQMIAKGLDISNVTLVGVLFADSMLYLDDYRANERAYGMLTQVAGRAGRGELAGRAVIQTYTPESFVIKSALASDYQSFIKEELAYRKTMLFPPFCALYRISFSANTMEWAMAAARCTEAELAKLFTDFSIKNVIMFPAAAAPIERIGGKFRARILVKCRDIKAVRDIFRNLLASFYKNKDFKNVATSIEKDPVSML